MAKKKWPIVIAVIVVIGVIGAFRGGGNEDTKDEGEKTYNADSDGAMYLGEDSIIFDEINPDASLTGKVVFDITQETIDAKDLVLQVQTEAFGSETENISLK